MFDSLQARLREADEPVPFFIRDDDADDDIPQLRRLLEISAHYGISLNLAVIPGTLTNRGAEILGRSASGLVSIHQHGWMHINHERTGRKSEFGESRTFGEQFDDIERGRRRLQEILGDRHTAVFTPPWNRCTPVTFGVLQILQFAVISRDRTAQPVATSVLAEVSVSVDLFCWKNGPVLKTAEQIDAEMAQQQGPVGLLLHHKVMDSSAFKLFEALCRLLSESRNAKVKTVLEILEGKRCGLTN
jgi:peptidoglycan/xylan/chitin deacetylase (PgdA/CDA1 family)